MSDNLHQAVEEVRTSLRVVHTNMDDMKRNFETFLVRFDEVIDMLVRHDTEQLQRVTAVERENATLSRRLDVVERKLTG